MKKVLDLIFNFILVFLEGKNVKKSYYWLL